MGCSVCHHLIEQIYHNDCHYDIGGSGVFLSAQIYPCWVKMGAFLEKSQREDEPGIKDIFHAKQLPLPFTFSCKSCYVSTSRPLSISQLSFSFIVLIWNRDHAKNLWASNKCQRWDCLTWKEELQGLTGYWPHLGGALVVSIAPEGPSVFGSHWSHRKQGQKMSIGVFLWVLSPGHILFSFLSKDVTSISLMWATLEGDILSWCYQRAWQSWDIGLAVES